MWQRDAAKERMWRRHVAHWRRSGLSVRAYCASEGLSEPSFYNWRRTLATRDREVKKRRGPRRRSVPAFVPVHVLSDVATSTSRSLVEVALANGRLLRVGTGFDAQVVRQLLVLLEEPAC
jgi:hypothetical protein